MTKAILITLLTVNIFASNLNYKNVKVVHKYKNKTKELIIKRHVDPRCSRLRITHNVVFGGDFAGEEIPKECKKTFITTLGGVQPASIGNVKTVGEIDLLKHISNSQKHPDKYVLIDSRTSDWYKELTIPSSVNIPYTKVKYNEDAIDDFKKLLSVLNIKQNDDDELDFTNAKSAILFCNGNWCVQSLKAIAYLVNMGYPEEKLFWYRGGMQDWLILGFTTVDGDLSK